jgi:hypothetical protein
MSTKLMSLAADLADSNVAAAQLIVSLQNAETGAELADALDAYDSAVLDSVTEPVDGSYYYEESPMIEQVLGVEPVAA